MLSVVWMIMLLLMLASVPVVRLECTSGASLRAQCSTLSVRSFLLHESQTGSVRIRCNHLASLSYSWSKSEDGSVANAVILDTSSDKYTVVNSNSLDITFSNVTKEDGGLYRCVYGAIGSTSELCVYVYERAVFASCPQEYSGCSEEVPSVTPGNSVIFNASVTYMPGGSCDFKQTISRIKLTKINEQSNLPNTLLFTCSTNQGAACFKNDDRLSLNRGDGLNFIFALSNARQSDSGIYEVVVEGTHPATSSLITIKKIFHLDIVSPPVPPSAPVGVQGLCSVVVWYSPEVSCEETIIGYEVRFYDLNQIQSNVTRNVGANKTFYVLTEEDRLAGENTYVQIRVLYSSIAGQWSNGISVGCDLKQASIPKMFNVYFVLNGTVYLNNSAVPLVGVGEDDHTLQCRTSRKECCKNQPYRLGDFFYPNETKVFNAKSDYGFYRTRGQKVIHLNRMAGVTSPTGKYRCEIPDDEGVMQNIFINLIE